MLIKVQEISLLPITSSISKHKKNINKSTVNMKLNRKYIKNMFMNNQGSK